MLRVVIDTSTLVSYVLSKSALLSRLIDAWRSGQFVLVTSPATRAELAQVLARPGIRSRTLVPLDELVAGLERFSRTVPGILSTTGVCRDPKDDKFVACAVEGNVDYLVSSDADLLALRWHREIAMVNPGQFLLALEMHSLSPDQIFRRHDRMVLERILANVPLQPDAAHKVRTALALHDGKGQGGV